MKSVVFDTSAIFVYLQNEAGHERIRNLLEKVKTKRLIAYISEISWMEIKYKLIQRGGGETADSVISNLEKTGIQFVPIDRTILYTAAAFKARGKISVADAIIAATAVEKNCPLLTKDPEFLLLKNEVKVEVL